MDTLVLEVASTAAAFRNESAAAVSSSSSSTHHQKQRQYTDSPSVIINGYLKRFLNKLANNNNNNSEATKTTTMQVANNDAINNNNNNSPTIKAQIAIALAVANNRDNINLWRRRWFVLKSDGCLYWYRNPKVSNRKKNFLFLSFPLSLNIFIFDNFLSFYYIYSSSFSHLNQSALFRYKVIVLASSLIMINTNIFMAKNIYSGW